MVARGGLEGRLVVERPDLTVDVELRVDPGCTLALLGPNGAGKSTVIEALCGLVELAYGRVTIGDRLVEDTSDGVWVAPDERRIGVVFQDLALFPHMTVMDNVAFGARAAGRSKRDARAQAGRWLSEMDLIGLATRRPDSLSGGEAQRVALARAVAAEPEVLLLDEPMSALDVRARADIRRRLADHLDDFDGPRILVTHDPAEAFLLADEVLVMEEGRATQRGTADEIRLHPRSSYAADLAGANLVIGRASGDRVQVDDHVIEIAGADHEGDVMVVVHPRAISLHLSAPEGSPRNSWETTVARIEHYGDRVRLQTGDPLPLTAEVTPRALEELGLQPGSMIWVSMKATEIGVQPV